MIRGLGQRRYGMLKSYFLEHILVTFLKLFFFKKDVVKSIITSKLHTYPPPSSVCFISQINIMHEYTETESKYTGKIGTHSMWGQMYIILLS